MRVTSLINKLDETGPLREPVIRRVIRRLELPEGSEGLDAGCGIGSHTTMLAEAVGPRGRVTGLDLSEDLLAHAGEMASRSGCGDRVAFRQGDVNSLPLKTGVSTGPGALTASATFPSATPKTGCGSWRGWSAPEATVAILLYSSQLLLPGHPGLEARLNATVSAMTAATGGVDPDRHFMRALGWFKTAGFEDATASTVVGTVQAPLDDATRRGLLSLVEMLWGESRSRMAVEDREEFLRLTDPDSAECLLNAPDYYGFFTYSMFSGKVPDR